MMDENAVVETAKDAKAVSSQGQELPVQLWGDCREDRMAYTAPIDTRKSTWILKFASS